MNAIWVRRLSLCVNAAVAVIVFASWLRLTFRMNEDGVLTTRGFGNLRYFTVLSNLLAGAAAAAYAVCLIRMLAGRAAVIPMGVVLVKYAGAVSVALTLMTVVLFLGPTAKTGFFSLFEGVNLWYHLLIPLLAIADFCLLNPDGRLPVSTSLAACVPMALYAAYYVGNLLINGTQSKVGHTNDWYGFIARGWGVGAVICVIIFAGTWGMALLMRLCHR